MPNKLGESIQVYMEPYKVQALREMFLQEAHCWHTSEPKYRHDFCCKCSIISGIKGTPKCHGSAYCRIRNAK